jgi:uncharacterized membrane protein YkvA (DUF1232 family)
MSVTTMTRQRSIVPAFMRPRAIMRFLKDGRASTASKIFFVTAMLYTVMPVDLIPDVAPILGWLDDLGMLTVSSAFLANRISKFEREYPEEEEVNKG